MVTPAQRARTAQHTSPQSGMVALGEEVIDMPFAPGDVIAGKYQVLKLIGSGGMGYVVSAMHVELGEQVALKFLRPEALQIEELVERFSREARAAAKIRSEHVARVYDVGVLPDGVPFIVMEHLNGQDLADVLQERGPLPIKLAIEYVMQACEALAAAHASGVVHRDIKPENLFLAKDAQGLDFIKILDFGISKVALAPGKRGFVRTMMPLGSPVYMSPEQIRSSDQVDARTDIWSLGCVLFELLTGTTAFNEPSLMQLSAAILEHDPVPLRELQPEASIELEDVVSRCLEKDVDRRYSNVAELAMALYPFAPRRSRISAERCYQALKNAGIECAEFEVEFQSVFPPSMGEVNALSSSPARAMTGAGRRLTSAAERKAGNALRTQNTPQLRTSALSPVTQEEIESLRPKKRLRLIGALAVLVMAGTAAFLFVQSKAADATGAAAGATPAGVRANAPGAGLKAGAVIDLDALTPAATPASGAPAGTAPASASAHTPKATPSYGAARRAPAMAPAAAKPTAPARKHDDDPDVGY